MPLIQTCLRRNMRYLVYPMLWNQQLMILVDPHLLSIFVCVHVHVCAPVYTYSAGRDQRVGQRSRLGVSLNHFPPHLTPHAVSLNLILANMAGQPASPKGLSPPSQCWDYKQALVSQFLQWILSVSTGVLMLALQACDRLKHLSRPTSHVPPAAFKNYFPLFHPLP